MNKPRVLVTGASGFTGHYVCKELEHYGFQVVALTQDGLIDGKSINLCSYTEVQKSIEQIQPESVVHLAAISFVEHDTPNDFYRVNVEGTLNLLRALLKVKSIRGTVVLASSANIYGDAYQNKAISENYDPNPINNYAVSKLSMEYVARLFMNKLPITIVRPFNYTGIGQNRCFLIPKIVNAFKKNSSLLELGNTDISRDFSDVRDIARYYSQLIINGTSGRILNFCSGKSISLHEIIAICEGLTGHKIRIQSSEKYQRKNELKFLLGNPYNLREVTRIQPLYSMTDTLHWMLTHG